MEDNSSRAGFRELFHRSYEELVSKFRVVGRSFLFLYLIPFIGVMILILLSIILTYPSLAQDTISDFSQDPSPLYLISNGTVPAEATVVFIAVLISSLIVAIFAFFLNLCYLHISLEKNSDVSFQEISYRSKKTFWRYLGFSIVFGVVLSLLYLLLIIPGIIFTVYWIFAALIFIQDRVGIFESMRRSKELVRGRWWKVFGYGILMIIVVMVVSIVLNLIPFIGFFLSVLIVNSFSIIFLKNFYFLLKDGELEKVEVRKIEAPVKKGVVKDEMVSRRKKV